MKPSRRIDRKRSLKRVESQRGGKTKLTYRMKFGRRDQALEGRRNGEPEFADPVVSVCDNRHSGGRWESVVGGTS